MTLSSASSAVSPSSTALSPGGASALSQNGIAGLFEAILNSLSGGLAGNTAGGAAKNLAGALDISSNKSLTESLTTSSNTTSGSHSSAQRSPSSAAILVLPNNLASLSEADLKAFLAKIGESAGVNLDNATLAALPLGTPATAPVETDATDGVSSLNPITLPPTLSAFMSAQTSALSTTGQDALATNNTLLVVTGITPADLDKLKALFTTTSPADATDTASRSGHKPAILDATNPDNVIASSTDNQDIVPFLTSAVSVASTNSEGAESDQDTPDSSDTKKSILCGTDPSPLSCEGFPLPLVVYVPPESQKPDGFGLANDGTAPLAGSGGITSPLLANATNTDTPLPITETDSPAQKSDTPDSKPASPFASFDSVTKAFGDDPQKTGAGTTAAGHSVTTHKTGPSSDSSSTVSTQLTPTGTGTSASLSFGSSWMPDNSSLSLGGAGTPLLGTASPLSSSFTNPLMTNSAAYTSHPSIQMVAMMIEKATSGSEKASQELSVQLDPPELGRLQIQLSYEKGEALKVHVLTEKEETLSLLQRDSHALKSALDHAGIKTDSTSLSFDMASGDQSFNQMLGGFHDPNARGESSRFTLDGGPSGDTANTLTSLETHLDFVPDMATGNVHYSLLV